ncbi:MAG TPA: methyltransferase domain-containing protein [Miltoncostaeaceae bacterium]|nr:methyltransferase domain-containing protein [Miltoncostaeaceae bacterium]
MTGATGFGAPADAYDRFVGRYGPALAAELVALAGVAPGMRALDVGCGPGALTRAVSDRVGPNGRVAAVDPSEGFAAACRARVPEAEVRVAPAEALPFRDGSFDVVAAQLVVNFMADAEAGVREMARVARPGGVVAACVWDYAGGMTLLRAFWDAAREVEPQAASRADEGVAMPWCREGDLDALWTAAGLVDVRGASVRVNAAYDDFEDLWTPLPAGVGPAGAWCAGLAPEPRAAVKEALRRRLDVADGPFVLPARAWAVVGTA